MAYTESCPAVEALLTFDAAGRPQPLLAKAWEVGADGKIFT